MVDEAQLSKAVAALTAGKPVVFPTDTVLWDRHRRRSARLLPRLFLLINVAIPTKLLRGLLALLWRLRAMAATCRSSRTIWFRSFGLGLLTLVVKAGDNVPEAFRGANDTIALRMPNDYCRLGTH